MVRFDRLLHENNELCNSLSCINKKGKIMILEGKNSVMEEVVKQVEKGPNFTNEMLENLLRWIINKAGSVLVAIIFIFIGVKLVSFLLKLLKRSFDRSKLDGAVSGFLLSILRILGYILVFITAATIVGFEVTSFVAILGTASLAVGLALQGALSNLAGGVLILLLKPFQVGDYILENNKGNEGTVVSVDIFYTRLRTHDNKIAVIPNGILANNSLVNLTNETKRKVEIKISIAYNCDMGKIKKIVYDILNVDERILKDDPMDVFIDSFGDSGMMLGIRAWVKTDDFWSTTWDMREKIKTAFDENNIEIPYNRLEVDLLNKTK